MEEKKKKEEQSQDYKLTEIGLESAVCMNGNLNKESVVKEVCEKCTIEFEIKWKCLLDKENGKTGENKLRTYKDVQKGILY